MAFQGGGNTGPMALMPNAPMTSTGLPTPALGMGPIAPMTPPEPQAEMVRVKRIEWKAGQKEELEKELKEVIKKALEDRTELDKKRAVWLKQYEGRLERVDKPKGWQSKMDISTTREALQAVRSRLVNPVIQQDKLMVGVPRKPMFSQLSQQVEDFVNYAYDQFDYQRLFMEWVEMAAIYGIAPMKVGFVNRVRVIDEWEQVEVPVMDQFGQQQMQPNEALGMMTPLTQPQWQETVKVVPDRVGVFPELIQPSDFIYPSTAVDLQTAEFIDHRVYLDAGTVKERLKKNPVTGEAEWDCKLEDLQKVTNVDQVTKTRERMIGIKPTSDRYDVHEIYYRKDMNGNGNDDELILTMDYTAGKIVRGIYNYYHDYKRPFVLFWWEKRPNSMEGLSLCYTIEHLHKAYSAIINMLLDSGTLAVKGYLTLTQDQELHEILKTQNYGMGDTLLVNSLPKESTMNLEFGKDPGTFLMGLAAQILNHINLLTSINMYNEGQEQVQRPTASGQNLLVEEGKQPLYEKLELFRYAITDLTLMMLNRYKQFYKNSAPYYNMVDDQLMPQLMEFPEGLIEDKVLVQPKASSARMNAQTRRQDIIGLMDRLGASYKVMLDLLNSGMQAAQQGTDTGMVAASFADGYQQCLNRLMVEFEVPNPEELNPPIQAVMQVGQQFKQMLMNGQQQMQQLQQQLQQGMQMAQEMQTKIQEDQKAIEDLQKQTEDLKFQLKVTQAVDSIKLADANKKGQENAKPAAKSKAD